MTRAGLPLRVNFAWTFAGNVVYAACQWGMLVVLAKLGSATMVGQFALALAITAPILMLSKMNLKGIQATDSRRDFQFEDYLALRLATTVISLVVIAGIVFVTGFRGSSGAVILIVGAAKAFETVSDIIYGLVQQHERMDRIAVSMMIKGGLSLLALGLGVYLTGSVLWGVTGLAVSWALVLLTYDIRSVALIQRGDTVLKAGRMFGREGLLRPCWQVRRMAALCLLALPLGIVMLVNSLGTTVPRYFIEHNLGPRQLGFFAAMAYLMVTGSTVVGALSDSASPRLSRYYALGLRAKYRQLLLKLVFLGFIFGAGGVALSAVAGRWILTMLYRPEYATHADVLIALSVVATFSYINWFLGAGLTSARQFKVQFPLNTGALLLTVGGCALLIPRLGLIGAGWALLSGVVFLCISSVGMLVAVMRRIPRPSPAAIEASGVDGARTRGAEENAAVLLPGANPDV